MCLITRRQGRAALLAVIAASAISSIAAPVASATATLGINMNRVFNGVGYYQPFVDMQLSAASSEGVRLVREDALWAEVEPNAPVNGVHTYNWAPLDFVEKNLAKYHMQWEPIIDDSAPWAETSRTGRRPLTQTTPPTLRHSRSAMGPAVRSGERIRHCHTCR